MLGPWHRAQIGVSFVLGQEELRIRPTNGFIVLGDGSPHRIDDTAELQARGLDLAGQIRAAMAAVAVPIPVDPEPGQRRACGQHGNCGQVRL
jgi:CRISPR-associated exonuclease Cas4